MRVSIHLYRTHDMDLVTLYKNPNFSFQKALKLALKSYVNHKPCFILPPATVDVSNYNFKSIYQLFFNFDEEKDADIIEWFKTIKDGKRTAAIKSVLRGSMIGPFAYGCCSSDTDMQVTNSIDEQMKNRLLTLIKAQNGDDVIFYDPPVRRKPKYERKRKIQDKDKSTDNKNTTNRVISKKQSPVKKTENMVKYVNNMTDEARPVTQDKPAPIAIDSPVLPDKTNIENVSESPVKEKIQEGFDFNGFGDFGSFGDTAAEENNKNDEDDFDLFSSIDSMLGQFQ